MAIVLSQEDLSKIVDEVFEKVSSQTLSIEQLEVVEDEDEIKFASTLPVLIYPKNEETDEPDFEAEGELKTIRVSKWSEIIESLKEAGEDATDQLNAASNAINELIDSKGLTEKIDQLKESTDALNAAIQSIQSVDLLDIINGETVRFDKFDEDFKGTILTTTIDLTDKEYEIIYSVKDKLFAAHTTDDDKYYSRWENGYHNMNLYQADFNLDAETTELQILKNKVYVCDSSLYVWDPKDEKNLTEISGTGSGGSGNGAFNLRTNAQILNAYKKDGSLPNPNNVKTIDDAINCIKAYAITRDDIFKYSKVEYAPLLGMQISIYDADRASYVTYQNNLTEWDLANFTNSNNWKIVDGSDKLMYVKIGNNITLNQSNPVLTSEQITSLITDNTINETLSYDDMDEYEKNSVKPVSYNLFSSTLNEKIGNISMDQIPNDLEVIPGDDSTIIRLARTDENGAKLPIGGTYTISGGGGGAGGLATSLLFTLSDYNNTDGNAGDSLLLSEPSSSDLTLQFWCDNISVIDDNFEIKTIEIRKGSEKLSIPVYKSNNTLVDGNATGTIDFSNKDFTASQDEPYTFTIGKALLSTSSSFQIKVTYTYTDEEGHVTNLVGVSNYYRVTIAKGNIKVNIPNSKLFVDKSNVFNVNVSYTSQLPGRYYIALNDQEPEELGTINNNETKSVMISPLMTGLNKVFIYCKLSLNKKTINGNGVYFEIYCTGADGEFTNTSSIITNLNYPNCQDYFDDKRQPCFYTKQYDQNTSFGIQVYSFSNKDTKLKIDTYNIGNISIDSSVNTTLTSIASQESGEITYKYRLFFRIINDKKTPRRINIQVENSSRFIDLCVKDGNYKIDLPSNDNLIFDFRAIGKTNQDANKDIWESNIGQNRFNAVFNNVKFTNECGWTQNSIRLNGDSNVEFVKDNNEVIQANMWNDITFAIKYRTSNTSNDNYPFIKVVDSTNSDILKITPTQIIVGEYDLRTAPDQEIDLVITSSKSATNNGSQIGFIYLNGVMSLLSTKLLMSSGSAFNDISKIIVGSTDGSTLPLNLNIYSLSLYNSFISENMSLGIRSLNETTEEAISEIVNKNSLFDVKIPEDNIPNYNYDNFENTYGKRVLTNHVYIWDDDKYTTDKNRERFLLNDQDLQNIPDGLRVVIIQGPYTKYEDLGEGKLKGNISEYVRLMDNDEPINKDIIDTLNEHDKPKKSLRIAGTTLWTYIKDSNSTLSSVDSSENYNYVIQRPVFSTQGTSAMNYAVKNLRVYTTKKSKVIYDTNPWPIKSDKNPRSFTIDNTLNNIIDENDKHSQGLFQKFDDDNAKYKTNIFGETSVNANGNSKYTYTGLDIDKHLLANELLPKMNTVSDSNNEYNPSGEYKVKFADNLTYYLAPLSPGKQYVRFTYEIIVLQPETGVKLTYDVENNKFTYNGQEVLKNDKTLIALLEEYGYKGFNSGADLLKYSFDEYGNCLNSEDPNDFAIIEQRNDKFRDADNSEIINQGEELFITIGEKTILSPRDRNGKAIVQLKAVPRSKSIDIYLSRVTAQYVKNYVRSIAGGNAFKGDFKQLGINASTKEYETEFAILDLNKAGDGITRNDLVYTNDNFSKPKKNKALGKSFGNAALKPLGTGKFIPGSGSKGIINGATYSNKFSDDAKGSIVMKNGAHPCTNFCIKLDYAESSGTQNTGGSRFTNDVFAQLVLTPPQKVDPTLRTSVDGQPGVMFSYSPTGWFGQKDKKYLFRGKINWNNDKSAQDLFGFEKTDYNAKFASKKLSDYAKLKLLNYFYGDIDDESNTNTTQWNSSTTDAQQKTIQKIIENTVDVGTAQCWEFSTGGNYSFIKDSNIKRLADFFEDQSDYVLTNETANGNKDLNISNYIKHQYKFEMGDSTKLKDTRYEYRFVYDYTDPEVETNPELESNNDTHVSSGAAEFACIGNFIPMYKEYYDDVIKAGAKQEDVAKTAAAIFEITDNNPQPITKELNINFGTVVWASVEGEPTADTAYAIPRPLWGIAFESRYPDYDFSLESWRLSTNQYQPDPTNPDDEVDCFRLNPIYINAVYKWISSFKSHENDLVHQRRFIQLAPYFLNILNFNTYYSLSELLLACDQRVKNQMFAIYYESDTVEASDNKDYNDGGEWTEHSLTVTEYVLTAYVDENTNNNYITSTSIPSSKPESYKGDEYKWCWKDADNYVTTADGNAHNWYLYQVREVVKYSYTGSVYKQYGNMEGRRVYLIFYDCDTTFGIDNTGNLSYSWNYEYVSGNEPRSGRSLTQNYGSNSVIWNMIKNCYSEYVEKQTTLDGTTYYYDLRIAYDLIRKYSSDQSSISIPTNGYNVLTGTGNSSVLSYTGILDYYDKGNSAMFTESLSNKDVIYKYYKVLNAYPMCQGNRIQHKIWWTDNRLKWLDAKYNTGIINSMSVQFMGAGSASFLLTARTAMEQSIFYAKCTSGYFYGDGSSKNVYTSNEFKKYQYDITFEQFNTNTLHGWYWFEDMIFELADTSTNKYINAHIKQFGDSNNQLKYLKRFKLNKFDTIFRSASTHKVLFTNDICGGDNACIKYDYCPSLQELYLYNEDPRYVLDLSNSANINKIDLYKTYTYMIKLAPGSFIKGSDILLTNPSNMNGITSSDGTNIEDLRMIFIGKNLPNFNFMDMNFYENNSNPATTSNSFNEQSYNKTGVALDKFKGIYLVNCGGDNAYKNNLQLLQSVLSNAVSDQTKKYYITIDNIELSGGLEELDQFLQKDVDGKLKVENNRYVPIVGSITESGIISDLTCGIIGKINLNVYPDQNVIDKYKVVFPNLDIIKPDYSYIKVSNFEDEPVLIPIQNGARISNPSNKTGYGYDTQYMPDGHMKNILNRRHKVLAKSKSIGLDADNKNIFNLAICKLNDDDSTKYFDNSEADLNGAEGDVFVYEPHYWYKGVNDWKTGEQYLFFSSTDDTTSLTKQSNKPADTPIRFTGNINSTSNKISNSYISADESLIDAESKLSNIVKTDPSNKTSVLAIKIKDVFKDVDTNDILKCNYLAFNSKLKPKYNAVLCTYDEPNQFEVNNQSSIIRILSVYNSIFDNEINGLYINTDKDKVKYSKYSDFICTDNLNIIHLPEDLDENDINHMWLLININSDTKNNILFDDAEKIFTQTQPTIYKDEVFIQDELILFKSQLDDFPFLDVYEWNEHKACLGGVYHTDFTDNRLGGNEYSHGLVSVSNPKSRSNSKKYDTLQQYITANKNNFSRTHANQYVNPGYLMFDYDMQKNIYIMSLIKYGDFNDKYIYGYNYNRVAISAQLTYYGIDGKKITEDQQLSVNQLGMRDSISNIYYNNIRNLKPERSDVTADIYILNDQNFLENEKNEIHNYKPNNSSTISNDDNVTLPFDNCLGYLNLVSSYPTLFQKTAKSLGTLGVIYNNDSDDKYRVVPLQSIIYNTLVTIDYGEGNDFSHSYNSALSTGIMYLGKYFDIFNAYSFVSEECLFDYGNYTPQLVASEYNEVKYICGDRFDHNSANEINLYAYQYGSYAGMEQVGGSNWIYPADFGKYYAGISALNIIRESTINAINDSQNVSTRLAYRGEIEEISNVTEFKNLAWTIAQ